MENFERAEVSKMEWLSYNDCILKIREYNMEKINLIQKINDCLIQFSMVQ
jgi:hypothetical protein